MNLISVIIILSVLIADLFRRIIKTGNGSLKGSSVPILLFLGEYILIGTLIVFISIEILTIILLLFSFIWPFIANKVVYYIYKKLEYSTHESNTKNKFNSNANDELVDNFKKELKKKNKINIQKVLDIFLNKFEKINSVKTLFSYLPNNKFKDITKTDEIKILNKMSNKSFEKHYDNYQNKYFEFKEIKSQKGELDIDFVDFNLANVRIQLFNNEYTMKKIKEYIDNLIIVDWNINKSFIKSNIYNYLGKTENGLIVGIRNTKNSISIAITDSKYN